MHRLIRQEEREAEGYHVILKNLKHNVILFFQLSFPEIFVLALKKGGTDGGGSTFSLRGLIGEQTAPTQMNGAHMNPKCFARGCVTESDVSFRH